MPMISDTAGIPSINGGEDVKFTERPRTASGTAHEASSGKSVAITTRTRRMSSAKAVTRMSQPSLWMSATSMRATTPAAAADVPEADSRQQPMRTTSMQVRRPVMAFSDKPL
jgi:hypothetical protein